MKFLLLLVLAGVVWLAFKKSTRRSMPPPARERPEEAMVACAHCGVHLPESESLPDGDRRYCCRAHLDAGPAPRNT